MNKTGNKTISITEKVMLFKNNGTGYDEIFKELSIAIYQYPEKKNNQNDDDAGEFYLFFIPRIGRMIDKYVNYGIPFEHYFHSTLSAGYKTFLSIQNRKAVITNFSESPDFFYDLLYCNEGTSYSNVNCINTENNAEQYNHLYNCIENIPQKIKFILQIDNRNKIQKASIKFRMFLLALRFANHLDKYKIDVITFLTGFNREWIILKFNNILNLIEERKQQLELLRFRRNKIFCKIRLLEKRLLFENDNYLRKILEEKIVRYKKYFHNTNRRIAVCSTVPSYRELAKELKIPRGTVGTGLRWIKEISRKGFK